MIKLSTAQLWVHDQDEALEFYTTEAGDGGPLGRHLAELGNFRWLTVGPPGQPDISIVLMAIPGPPVMDADTAEQVKALMAKGFAGTVFFTTDDVYADYEELKSRGVEFSESSGGAPVRDRLRLPRSVGEHLPPDPGPGDVGGLSLRPEPVVEVAGGPGAPLTAHSARSVCRVCSYRGPAQVSALSTLATPGRVCAHRG